MFVNTKTACVTCPRLFVRGSCRIPIGAKNARKMCDIASIKNTRSRGASVVCAVLSSPTESAASETSVAGSEVEGCASAGASWDANIASIGASFGNVAPSLAAGLVDFFAGMSGDDMSRIGNVSTMICNGLITDDECGEHAAHSSPVRDTRDLRDAI